MWLAVREAFFALQLSDLQGSKLFRFRAPHVLHSGRLEPVHLILEAVRLAWVFSQSPDAEQGS